MRAPLTRGPLKIPMVEVPTEANLRSHRPPSDTALPQTVCGPQCEIG